jgi:hypothetical protein
MTRFSRFRGAFAVYAGVALAALTGCKHEADVHGTVTQAGKGVPGSSVSLSCPDGSKRVTSTNATGDFRFEEVGPGLDDACMVEVSAPGSWIAPLAIGTRCGQHEAGGKCTEAIFAFQAR